ncbi:MAG: hypothetical protein K1Y36_17985 [Blastocatellia bacterium]|nr:hypothetical protein [Blastocatellia bacterium]
MISAACYEHTHIIGHTPQRMTDFEAGLLTDIQPLCTHIYAWSLLPNHYHILVKTEAIKQVRQQLGRLHGRTSHQWNGQDQTRGRKVWHNCLERLIKSERHFWASLNYVHHNPVHHGYVEKWQDWPWSSAAAFIETHGRETVSTLWRQYPILDYGKNWDID